MEKLEVTKMTNRQYAKHVFPKISRVVVDGEINGIRPAIQEALGKIADGLVDENTPQVKFKKTVCSWMDQLNKEVLTSIHPDSFRPIKIKSDKIDRIAAKLAGYGIKKIQKITGPDFGLEYWLIETFLDWS